VVGARDVDEEEEADKISIVEMPHTIINPRTMMIYESVSTNEWNGKALNIPILSTHLWWQYSNKYS